MDLFLQFGWGMMEHCQCLIRDWGGGSVIVSPRDLSPRQLVRLAGDLRAVGGSVLLDPQFYLPHADHERLRSHPYWPATYDSTPFWAGTALADLLNALRDLNRELGCSYVILPGLHASVIDDDWLARQAAIIDGAQRINADGGQLLATVSLGEDVGRDEEQIDIILDAARDWAVAGIYLVCEHPRGEYLVADPIWIANILDLAAGLRLQDKRVILGYCNHQMLIATCVSVTAIASGTWMNVRSFPPEKFRAPYDDEVRTCTTWYYCPPALSEYKVPFLDVALRQGLLSQLATPPAYGSHYSDALFQDGSPSHAGLPQRNAFRHYLHCLHHQATTTRRSTFDGTIEACDQALDEAQILLQELHAAGVRGQQRDFGDIVDSNRAALRLLESSRGPILRRRWDAL